MNFKNLKELEEGFLKFKNNDASYSDQEKIKKALEFKRNLRLLFKKELS